MPYLDIWAQNQNTFNEIHEQHVMETQFPKSTKTPKCLAPLQQHIHLNASLQAMKKEIPSNLVSLVPNQFIELIPL